MISITICRYYFIWSLHRSSVHLIPVTALLWSDQTESEYIFLTYPHMMGTLTFSLCYGKTNQFYMSWYSTWDSRGRRRPSSLFLPRGCPYPCRLHHGCCLPSWKILHGLLRDLLSSSRPWLLPSGPKRWRPSSEQPTGIPCHKTYDTINKLFLVTQVTLIFSKCFARQCPKLNMLWCNLVTDSYWAFIN